MFKKRRGITLVELAIYALVLGIFAYSMTGIGSTSKNVSSDMMKDQAFSLDTALSLWYRSNHGTYPSNLSDLKTGQLISKSVSLSGFNYSVQGGNTKYRLTVNLPNGQVYTSPGSKY